MDFRQITMMQKIKSGIEINVTTPEGKNYCTNVKLKADDMELFDSFKNMQG